MPLALDHAIFGNGFGMASPFHDARYFWLVDTYQRDRDGRFGQLYQWIGGLGAQLECRQRTHPRAGERRRLAGREFVVFNSRRRWLRVEASWALVDLPHDLTKANATIADLQRDLGRN